MFATIIKASENFCIHQIRAEHQVHDNLSDLRTLIAYIDIEMQNDNKTHRVYVCPSNGFAQRISTLFLEEDQSDEETLVDMTLEIANLIVGSAKVVAEELGENPFVIKTPHFEKIDKFDFNYDEIKVIQVQKDEIIIAVKELD